MHICFVHVLENCAGGPDWAAGLERLVDPVALAKSYLLLVLIR